MAQLENKCKVCGVKIKKGSKYCDDYCYRYYKRQAKYNKLKTKPKLCCGCGGYFYTEQNRTHCSENCRRLARAKKHGNYEELKAELDKEYSLENKIKLYITHEFTLERMIDVIAPIPKNKRKLINKIYKIAKEMGMWVYVNPPKCTPSTKWETIRDYNYKLMQEKGFKRKTDYSMTDDYSVLNSGFIRGVFNGKY